MVSSSSVFQGDPDGFRRKYGVHLAQVDVRECPESGGWRPKKREDTVQGVVFPGLKDQAKYHQNEICVLWAARDSSPQKRVKAFCNGGSRLPNRVYLIRSLAVFERRMLETNQVALGQLKTGH